MKKHLLIGLFFFMRFHVYPQTMTLSECVRIALENNPGLKISMSEAQSALEDVHQAWSNFLPSLDFSGSYRRQSMVPELHIKPITLPFSNTTYSPFPGNGIQLGSLDNYDFKVTLAQPIFTGFKLINRKKMSGALASGKSEELAKSRAELIYKVETAFCQLLKIQKYLEIAKNSENQVNTHLRDVENLIQQGMAKKDELLKVQVKKSEAELAMLQAENGVQLSKTIIENIIGRKLPDEAVFSPVVQTDTSIFDITNSIRIGCLQRSELKFLDHAKTAAKAAKNMAQAGMYPSIIGFGSIGYGKPGLDILKRDWMDYWLIGIGAEWNLWSWGRTRSQIFQTQLKIDALDNTRQQIHDAIILDITQACLLVDESVKRVRLTASMEQQAAESFRVTENTYRQGQVRHTEYFDAQSEWTRSQIQKTQAEIDLVLAKANWRRAVGSGEAYYKQ